MQRTLDTLLDDFTLEDYRRMIGHFTAFRTAITMRAIREWRNKHKPVRVCSWCPTKDAQEEDARSAGLRITHTICDPCRERFVVDSGDARVVSNFHVQAEAADKLSEEVFPPGEWVCTCVEFMEQAMKTPTERRPCEHIKQVLKENAGER